MKKLNHEEFLNKYYAKFPESNLLFITTYENSDIKMLCYCIEHMEYFWSLPSNLMGGRGCPICADERRTAFKTKTHEQFIKGYYSKFPNSNLIFLTEYIKGNKEILCYCPIHMEYFWKKPDSLMAGRGCPICGKEKTITAVKKKHEQYVKEVAALGLEVMEPYQGSDKPILHRCIKHDKIFKAAPHEILCGATGCPICRKSQSRGAAFVEAALIELKLKYDKEWRQIINGRNRYYDFYIPSKRTIIEFDGEQHFMPIRFGGILQEKAEENFVAQQQGDADKDKWAIDNGYILLRIPYYWSDGEKKQYLVNYFKESD